MKKVTVSIGVAAHNEEKNIYSLLSQIVKLTESNWKLSQIIIYCDGCVDNTIAEIKRHTDPRIIILDGKKQKGKCFGLNQIFNKAKSDYLVLLDADIKIERTNLVTNLLTSFIDKNVAVVGGNVRPFAPKTFFQRAVYSTFLVFDESRKNIRNGHNVFGCNGGCEALRTSFAKTLHIPNIINDDDFIYFSCISKGYTFRHNRDAVIYYKLPTNLKDYLKQVFRSNPTAVTINIEKYFGKLVQEHYYRSPYMYVKAIGKVVASYPIETITIILINLFCKPLYTIITKNYKLSWHDATSTK